jgi:hypothetical protein
MLLSIPEHMNPFYLCPYAQPLAQADPTKPDLGIMVKPFFTFDRRYNPNEVTIYISVELVKII